VVFVGRTLLLFGSREEIARRLTELRGADLSAGVTLEADELDDESDSVSLDFELNFSDAPDAQATLHTLAPPELPTGLSPGQAAQLAELIHYLHLRVRGLVQSVGPFEDRERMTIEQRQWQNIVDLQQRLAGYLRSVGEPGE